MNQSVSGCVVDETTGEPLTSPDIRLYRIGVSGETCNALNEHGCFSLPDDLGCFRVYGVLVGQAAVPQLSSPFNECPRLYQQLRFEVPDKLTFEECLSCLLTPRFIESCQ